MAAAAHGASLPNGSRRAVWMRLALVVGAVVVGLLLNHLLQDHLAALQTLAATDPIAARARLAAELRIGGIGLFVTTGALGASLIAAARRARRDERFPPAGVWGWGATRTLTGPPARLAGVVGIVLGALLVGCSVAGAALSWEIGSRLLQCRAGVPASVPWTLPDGTEI